MNITSETGEEDSAGWSTRGASRKGGVYSGAIDSEKRGYPVTSVRSGKHWRKRHRR